MQSSASGEGCAQMAYDLKIEIPNEPGALERVAAAVTDAGVNIAAATCTGPAEIAELHILVPHAEPVIVEAHDVPGELADMARKVAHAGINIDLLYVATRNRVVFGAADLDGLRAALGV